MSLSALLLAGVILDPAQCVVLKRNLERTSLSQATIDREYWDCIGRATIMRRALNRSTEDSLRLRETLKNRIRGVPYDDAQK